MGAGAPVAGPKSESVRSGTIILALARIGRFSLGFLATLLIAQAFGAGRESDAFFVARVIPVLFMDWAGNILKVGFIPTRSEVEAERGPAAATRVSLQFGVYTSAVFGVLAVVCAIVAPVVVRGVGIGLDAETHALGSRMLVILSPAVFFGGIFVVTETLLNARQHFSSPARARVAGRLVVVIVLLAGAGPIGEDAMPLAFLAGSIVQLALAGPAARSVWTGVRGALTPIDPGLKVVGGLLVPALVWMLLDQLKFVADQMFASRLASGQLAALNYAFQIVQVTVAVGAGAYLTALFPALSQLVARRGDVARRATDAGRRVLVMGALPAMLFAGAAAPLVRIVLERGAFTREATLDTAGALLYYAPAVLLISFNMLLKILLFLRRRTGPILAMGLGELALNVALNAAFVGPMGIGGLALATSVTTLVVTLGLPSHLSRSGLLLPRELVVCAVRLVPGMLAGFWVTNRVASMGMEQPMFPAAAWLGGGMLAGGLVYVLAALALGVWPALRLRRTGERA